LDEETGLYYYGARYYDPRTSVWISVDPLANYDPINNEENYWEGEHNGGIYNARNLNVYGYCYQNPVRYVDPNGKQSLAIPRYVPRIGRVIEIPEISIPRIPLPPIIPIMPNFNSQNSGTTNASQTNESWWDKADMKDTNTWENPPGGGKFTPGDPSKQKPKQRGEKSLYDERGGEWRPHKPDKFHPEGHWDYKPKGNNTEWENVYPSFVIPSNANFFQKMQILYQEWKYKRELEQYQKDLKNYQKKLDEYIRQYGA